jgi:hypothetical protein
VAVEGQLVATFGRERPAKEVVLLADAAGKAKRVKIPRSLLLPGIREFKRAWNERANDIDQLGFTIPPKSVYENWRSVGGPADAYLDALIANLSRHTTEKNLHTQLSSKRLDDVPADLDVRSPTDVEDTEVIATAEKTGRLHSRANEGVAYRVLFAPGLDAGEVARFILFGAIARSVAVFPRGPREPRLKEAKPG